MRCRVIFGTRPEFIKLAPVILELRARGHEVDVISTGQHRDLLVPLYKELGIHPDLDLEVMDETLTVEPEYRLPFLYGTILCRMDKLFDLPYADWTIVQGDTATTYCAALWCHLSRGSGGKLAHVEAGLRTPSLAAPFPEEANRRMVTVLADAHFPPTEAAAANLAKLEKVFKVGNTVVDAARAFAPQAEPGDYVLVTCHRRENQSALWRLCQLIKTLVTVDKIPVKVVCHPHPGYREFIEEELQGYVGDKLELLPPQGYTAYLGLIRGARALLTDSGGSLEEASALGTYSVIWRTSCERMEAVRAGHAALVGNDVDAGRLWVKNPMTVRPGTSPFGDGCAAAKIVSRLEQQ